MSWIVKDLWKTLEERRAEYQTQLETGSLQAFWTINRIASEVGARWGVLLQLNFPPGARRPDIAHLGRQNLTILVHRERRKFEGVTQQELKNAFKPLDPVSFDGTGFGYEGFKVRIPSGRIDCLPGGVHLWCEITPKVLEFLDWLFVRAYGLKPAR